MIDKFLGIEYSCDDTSVAIVSSDKNVIFHKTISQSYTTGVVPEIAARRHLHTLHDIVLDINISDLQGIAATFGPGLVSSLMTGVNFAKGLSLAYGIPLYKVNHLEAHMLSVSLTEDIPYPYLSLLISGGHTQLVLVKSVHEFEILGNTIDDALGECFDKIAKSMNLEYPGGPTIEKYALLGNKKKYNYSKPLYRNNSANMSFSGLKTQVIRSIDFNNHYDVSASFIYTVCKVLEDKIKYIMKDVDIKALSVSGGVGANKLICDALYDICQKNSIRFFPVNKKYCSDNGAMIAWAGLLQRNKADLDDKCFATGQRFKVN